MSAWSGIGEAVQASVRPLVTFALTAGVLSGWWQGQISADAYLGLAGAVIGFWFSTRSEGEASKAAAVAATTAATTVKAVERAISEGTGGGR
jgi:hypothetical protein